MFEKDYIKELANVLVENGLTEISLKDGEKEVVLRKEIQVAAVSSAPAMTMAPAQVSSTPEVQQAATKPEKSGKPVTSPMVGTFYKSSSPDADPFVKVGDTVQQGQVVCIIEAMKLMNEIEADVAGKIIEICVEDGQPVEFGQVLMYVE